MLTPFHIHSIQVAVDPTEAVMMAGAQCGDQLSAFKDCGDDELSPELYSDMVCASQVNCLKYGLQLLF